MRASTRFVAGGGLAVALCGGCSSSGSPAPSPAPTGDRTTACPDPGYAALPAWASGGFATPTQPVAHLVGVRESIVAVPFGWPLRDHQPPGRDNKTLWIAKSGNGPMHIVATEQGSGATATRDLPSGPGPSIVDMPTAGCWRFSLSWSDQHDEVLVKYDNETATVPRTADASTR